MKTNSISCWRGAALLACAALLAACSSAPLSGDATAGSSGSAAPEVHVEPFSGAVQTDGFRPRSLSQAPKGALLVPVYYATDRQYLSPEKGFGVLPNMASPYLSYGSVMVSIPEASRRIGEILLPSWYNFFSKNDAAKYFVIQDISVLPAQVFFDYLAASVRENPGRRAAFVYIHGYSNSFADAAMRTAQIAVDLHFPVVPTFYSWPSRGEARGYPDDEESSAWSEPHLRAFLSDFADKSAADDIYVIAHSMGGRPTVLALAALMEQRPELQGRFRQIILAAPDINATIFRSDIAPRFAKLSAPVTVYASSNDRALRLSDGIHGWPRLGEVKGPIARIPGIEIIDASSIATDFMGHAYFSDDRALLTDISYLFKTGLRAGARAGLVGVPTVNPQYWAFP